MSGSKITIGQIKCIGAMMSKLKLQDQKEHMVAGLTFNRTTSIRELTVEEGTQLIRYIKSLDPEEKKAEDAVLHEAQTVEAALGLYNHGTKLPTAREIRDDIGGVSQQWLTAAGTFDFGRLDDTDLKSYFGVSEGDS